MSKDKQICYCLELFKKKYGSHVQGTCFKLKCARYRKETEKEKNEQNR